MSDCRLELVVLADFVLIWQVFDDVAILLMSGDNEQYRMEVEMTEQRE